MSILGLQVILDFIWKRDISEKLKKNRRALRLVLEI